MENLSSVGQAKVKELANTYHISESAVLVMLQAVRNGNGTMAQFNHPDLGGYGQWMRGGMTMVGDMFNNDLKAKVDRLANDVSNLLQNEPNLFANTTSGSSSSNSQTQYSGQGGYNTSTYTTSSWSSFPTSGQWWPEDLGSPASSGSQNNTKYAIFPYKQRLAILVDGKVTVYDTQNHQVNGISQQQGGVESMTFTSQYGTVRLADLPVVK